MRTETEIRARIQELESDERHGYEPASVFANAPLAIIQASISAELLGLYFALGEVPPRKKSNK